MELPKKFAIRSGVIIGAAILGYIFFGGPLVEPIEPRRKLKAQSEAKQLEISALLSTNAARWLLKTNGSVILSEKEMYAILFSNGSTNFPTSQEYWPKQGPFPDPWGNDYYFLFDSKTNQNKEVVWFLKVKSFGKDGIDNHGTGDDIVGPGVEIVPSRDN